MWYKNAGITFFHLVTNHAFDGQIDGRTDRQTEFSSLDRVCIPCSAVKISYNPRRKSEGKCQN